MISQTAEYCLRAIVFLAGAEQRARTTHQIADATKIPVGYLSKVLLALGRAGLVSAQRGINGGFLLACDPATLSLLDVVRIADTSHRITTCPLGIHGKELCSLHRQLDEVAAFVEETLASRTIAQLMATPDVIPVHSASHTRCACSAGSGAVACLK